MKHLLVLGVVALALPSSAIATVITAPVSGSSVETMPGTNQFSGGPIVFGNNVTWTSEVNYSVFGWTNSYGFANNGTWTGAPAMAGTNDTSAAMRFTLDGDATSVGGTINWALPGYGSATMSIFDSSNVLLESFLFTTGTTNLVANDAFYGFSRAQGDIRSFELRGAYIGLRELTVGGLAAVPEPSVWTMLLIGFGVMGSAMRSKKVRQARVSYS